MKIKRTLFVIFLCLIQFASIAETLAGEDVNSSSVKISGYNLHFNISGSGPLKIIFLHGLFADRAHWAKMSEFFNGSEYSIIAPDLPCYGQSDSYPVRNAALENQVQLLHDFIKKLSLKKVNLAGNSLGGMLALAYSVKFPDDISSVCLIGASAGLFPWSDDMIKRFNMDMNPFIPLSADEFKYEMKCLFMNPPILPEDYITNAVKIYSENRARFISIFDIVSISIYNFSVSPLPELKFPVMMILGTGENIFNIKNAENILKTKIPGCKLYFIQDAGHLLMLEQPDKVAGLYIKFLKK